MSTPISVEDLARIVAERGASARSLTGVAGAPGSGKSTLADALAARLNAAEPGSAAVLPMDGYHYDDALLKARGWHSRKGAPHTFDAAGFAHMLDRLARNAEEEIAVPVFDREIEIARNAARAIPRGVRHLIVEGNYLFLQEDGWAGLYDRFDTTVFLDVPPEVLRARLEHRWRDLSAKERAWKLDGNDLPNGEAVRSRGRAAEFVLREG